MTKESVYLRLDTRICDKIRETGDKMILNRQGVIEHIIREFYAPKDNLV